MAGFVPATFLTCFALLAALFFVGSACVQQRPAVNEFTTWFGGQFANKHAFSDTVDGRLYQFRKPL
jgi:hypothetical protein